MEEKQLEQLKIGSKLSIFKNSDIPELLNIIGETNTTWKVGKDNKEILKLRKDSHIVGSNIWDTRIIKLQTQEHINIVIKHKYVIKFQNTDFNELTIKQLRKIYSIISE